MKRSKMLFFVLVLAFAAATASVRSFDGDPKPPCLPGVDCNVR